MRRKDPGKKKEILNYINQFYKENYRTPSTREIAENTSLQKTAVQRYLAELREEGQIDYDSRMIMTEEINDEFTDLNRAGVIGSIPCGPLTLEQENIEEYVNLPVSIFGGGKLFILHTYGDSMEEAGIDEGDLVVVRKQCEAKNGDLVVAYVEGEGCTLKRIYKNERERYVILHPENKKYKDLIVNKCQIQGVVVNIIKKTDAGRRGLF